MTRCEDELAIRRLASRYCDAINTRSAVAAADCYQADGQWQPLNDPPYVGHEQLIAVFESVFDRYEFMFQMLHQGLVTFDEMDPFAATARWHFSELGRETGSTAGMLFMGVCEDNLRCVDGSWKFAKRVARGHYMGRIELTGKVFKPFFSP